MSGADQRKAELRSTSIKGLLRWWWRALRSEADLEALQKEELELFGGVTGKMQRKSKVTVAVRWLQPPEIRPIDQFSALKADTVKYLAYGIGVGDSNPVRPAFSPGQEFELLLKYPDEREGEMAVAISLMLTYGGFGAKSKNGFGQVFSPDIALHKPEAQNLPGRYPNFKNWEHLVSDRMFDSAERAHEWVANAYYVSKNPRVQGARNSTSGNATLSNSGDKNLFAAHSPDQFELLPGEQKLQRKAKPVQLYIRHLPEDNKYLGTIKI